MEPQVKSQQNSETICQSKRCLECLFPTFLIHSITETPLCVALAAVPSARAMLCNLPQQPDDSLSAIKQTQRRAE